MGVTFAAILPGSVAAAAQTVLFPLAGIFVGLSFAWVGNAQAVLQSTEIERLIKENPGGVEAYAYTFQSAILAILVTLVAWGLAALGVFDQPCGWECPGWMYPATVAGLFALASLTVRECWHVVMGAQLLLLSQRYLARLPHPEDRDPREEPDSGV